MPKLEYKGLEDFGGLIDDLNEQTEACLKMAVYDGAHQVFEEVKRQIQNLPTSDDKQHGVRNITEKQKQGLLSGLYGSKILTQDGGVWEYIGFTGYNSIRTKKHPQGQPNILIARSVESGGTYMIKRPFISKARNAARAKALAAAKQTFEQQMEKITKG